MAFLQDKRAHLKSHMKTFSEDHLNKTWSAFLRTRHELKGNVEEIRVRVETLQLEKRAIEVEFDKLKQAERNLEVENMSLKEEVAELRRKLKKVDGSATTENMSLTGLVQTMQKKLEALEKDVTKLKVKNQKCQYWFLQIILWLNRRAGKMKRN